DTGTLLRMCQGGARGSPCRLVRNTAPACEYALMIQALFLGGTKHKEKTLAWFRIEKCLGHTRNPAPLCRTRSAQGYLLHRVAPRAQVQRRVVAHLPLEGPLSRFL